MTLLSHTIVVLLWMGCTTCKASTGAACEDPPLIDFGDVVSGNKSGYEENDRVQYMCNPGYTLSGSEWVTCHEKIWVPGPPQCLAPCTITKQQLEAQNLLLSNGQRRTFLIQSGRWQNFKCMTGFKLSASSIKQCVNGHIEFPSCITEKPCDYPAIENGKLSGSLEYHKNYYFPMRVGQYVDYHCANGYSTPSGHYWVRIVCSGRGWSPEPKCLRKGGKCGPPPVIENGDLLSFPMQEYTQGSVLEYKCPSLYVLEGSRRITCTDGQWTSPPVCLAACTVSEEDMGRNNIELKWVAARKLYSRSGDFIDFQCKRGYMADPESPPFRAQCMKGTLEYPQCKPGKNCTVLKSIMERNNIQLQSSSWSTTYTYQTGDTILFECKWWYRQVSHPEKFRPECVDGAINYPTCERRY